MADGDIEKIWKAAVERYQKKTGKTLEDAFPNMPDKFDVSAVLTQVDKDSEKYQQYKDHRKALDDVLRPVLHVVGELAETVGEAVALVYPPSKAISVAVCWLVAVGKNYADKYDTIIEVFSHLKQTLGRLRIHSAHPITAELQASVVDTLSHTLILLGTARRALEEGRLKQVFKIAGGKAGELKEALAQLEKITAQETSVVSAETLSVVNTVLDKLNRGIDAELRAILRDISVGIQSVTDEQFQNWLEKWLNPPNASYNHQRHVKSRKEGTGAWFLNGSQFAQWKEASRSFMWIQGAPGCGKSVLCSSAIDAVKSDCKSNPDSTYLYFYFDFSDAAKQSYEGLLGWLIRQLAGSFDGVPPPLIQLRESSRNGAHRPDPAELAEAIQELCAFFGDVYLILDALDECACTELGFVLDFLDVLQDCGLFHLHTLLTSRPEPEIVNRFKQSETRVPVTVVLAQDIVWHDIELYIQERVFKEPQLNRYGQVLCDEIRKHLSEKANGMFRWVSLQLDHLGACRTAAKVKEALKQLPPTLVATYSRTLSSLKDDDVPYVAMMLAYLMYSTRRLTIDELAAAAAVDLDSDDPLNPDKRFPDREEVLKLCPGFVTVLKHPWKDITYVQFAHFSVQEFLVSDAASYFAVRFNLQREPAHCVISQTSLLVLNSLDEPDMTREAAVKRQPLASHAAEFWPYHFRSSSSLQSNCDAQLQLVNLFDHTKHCFQNWIICYDYDYHKSSTDSRAKTTAADSLYYASAVGVYDACLMLLKQGAAVNQNVPGRVCGSALGVACFEGHAEIVKLLLDRGADANIVSGRYGSSLGAACYQNHAELVKLLLDRGADVNIVSGPYGSPMGGACYENHVELVKLLLDRGANVDIPSGHYGSPLGLVCYEKHTELVKLLLDRGADVNIPGKHYGSPLGLACYRNHAELVKLLLDRGADVNIPGRHHGSPLGLACYWNHAELVELLLDRGADVNIPGGNHGSPLGAACYRNHAELVVLLLDRGADLNIPGGHHGLPLGLACY